MLSPDCKTSQTYNPLQDLWLSMYKTRVRVSERKFLKKNENIKYQSWGRGWEGAEINHSKWNFFLHLLGWILFFVHPKCDSTKLFQQCIESWQPHQNWWWVWCWRGELESSLFWGKTSQVVKLAGYTECIRMVKRRKGVPEIEAPLFHFQSSLLPTPPVKQVWHPELKLTLMGLGL